MKRHGQGCGEPFTLSAKPVMDGMARTVDTDAMSEVGLFDAAQIDRVKIHRRRQTYSAQDVHI